MNPLVQHAFLHLSTHAQIHKQLNAFDRKYRTILTRIEESQIRSYDDPQTFAQLEEMKKELLQIRFVEKKTE